MKKLIFVLMVVSSFSSVQGAFAQDDFCQRYPASCSKPEASDTTTSEPAKENEEAPKENTESK